jgi:hypothetical protein
MTAIARYPSSLVSKIQSGSLNGFFTVEAIIGTTKSGSGFLGMSSQKLLQSLNILALRHQRVTRPPVIDRNLRYSNLRSDLR